MYNYGMPSPLTAWFDKVIRIGKTFTFDLARGDAPLAPIMSGKRCRAWSKTSWRWPEWLFTSARRCVAAAVIGLSIRCRRVIGAGAKTDDLAGGRGETLMACDGLEGAHGVERGQSAHGAIMRRERGLSRAAGQHRR